jgi:pimeloyl-ACP methyl ester carboxylesterase
MADHFCPPATSGGQGDAAAYARPVVHRIEHLLSARLYLSPQVAGDRLFFISDLSGRLSLYAMDRHGSVPEPLLPPDVALMTPELLGGEAFVALPDHGIVVVLIDEAGDENYQPCVVPIDGGDPEPMFGARFAGQQVALVELDQNGVGSIWVDPRVRPEQEAYEITVGSDRVVPLGASKYGNDPMGHSDDRTRYVLVDGYTEGDMTLWLWERETGERRLLNGVPLESRVEGETVPLTGFGDAWFVEDDRALVVSTTLFDDARGLGWVDLAQPEKVEPVEIVGARHRGTGELASAKRIEDDRIVATYNVDGVSWGYEARFDAERRRLELGTVLWGAGALADGVVQHSSVERSTGRHALAFSSATTPVQVAVVESDGSAEVVTRNRIIGLDPELLARGEDASYQSHDGLRVSARLYLPAPGLGFEGSRPVVHYVHGGPQSQERPDFTWFSIPMIQFLTLRGLAVFVPNVRGSTGYGLTYTKHVDRDWGGQDRLDHVAGVEHLRADPRLDVDRIGVMGRSYGGYMTLMLAGLHPEIWSAACDMFGPYDLPVWLDRLPEAWKVYFEQAIGHPERDRERLVDRSPRTHLGNLACPLLVVQGANDPRVVRAESDDLVTELRAQGKQVDYLVFDDEGHDLTRTANRVLAYNAITYFFSEHLKPR